MSTTLYSLGLQQAHVQTTVVTKTAIAPTLIPDNQTAHVTMRFTAYCAATGYGAAFTRCAGVKRHGSLVILGTTSPMSVRSPQLGASWLCGIEVVGNNVQGWVMGQDGVTIEWDCFTEVLIP
jgi:hypothetical protein